MSKKRVHILTLGCAKNTVDSESMAVLLKRAGYISIERSEGADILIVGRYITQSRDVERSVREFLPLLQGDIDLFRVHVE